MRAFLSDVDGGPAFLRAPLFADVTGRTHVHGTMARDDAFAAAWAEREARAILGVVEPEDCGTYQRLSWLGDWSGDVAALLAGFVGGE